MHALLYRSSARPGLLASDLNDVIATAEARNPRLGVTGLLLYGELEVVPGAPGEFVQWIEGPERAVEDLFEVVSADPRHGRVEVLGRGPVSSLAAPAPGAGGRLFPTWSMGMVRLAALPATLDGFVRFAESWDRRPVAKAA